MDLDEDNAAAAARQTALCGPTEQEVVVVWCSVLLVSVSAPHTSSLREARRLCLGMLGYSYRLVVWGTIVLHPSNGVFDRFGLAALLRLPPHLKLVCLYRSQDVEQW